MSTVVLENIKKMGIFIKVKIKNNTAKVFIIYRYMTAPSPRYIEAELRPLNVSLASESESESGTSFIVSGLT